MTKSKAYSNNRTLAPSRRSFGSKCAKYAKTAGNLSKKQFNALKYLIATSINFKDADGLISKFFPRYDIKQKLGFLADNFNFQVGAGNNLSIEACYGFVVQFILSEARDFGPEFVIRK